MDCKAVHLDGLFFCPVLDCFPPILYNYSKHLDENEVKGMGSDPRRNAAQWFYSTVFREETIRPRVEPPARRVPSPIRAARSLENSDGRVWQSRESVFLKQAKLLASYEDDYAFDCPVVRYYPTYQSLTDEELRGYFSWRTKLRGGDVRKTSLSFAFLYIYELINQVGVSDPMDGYGKLKAFRDTYGSIDKAVIPYLNRWLFDYVVYYGLEAGLLADTPQVLFDRRIAVLENLQSTGEDLVVDAVRGLSPKWLERSKFYGEYPADFDRVLVRVLGRVSAHYAAHCKKTMTEQYFGIPRQYPLHLFDTAVFCDPLKTRDWEYAVDDQCVYRCKDGLWSVWKRSCPPRPNEKLGDLLKAIDSLMRQEYAYRHPIQCPTDTKWLLKIIREEIQTLQTEKKAAEAKKITIDYSQLQKIRWDAAVTRDKLIVDEEEPELPETPPLPQVPEPAGECPLDKTEYRLLQSLLYGGDINWVQTEGHLLSVLADSINEKLYDTFLDSVLEDGPALIEDYIDDLKGMVHP